MKQHLLLLLFLILFVLGCDSDSKLTFEILSLENEACIDCPEIKINVPKAKGETRIVETINTTISEELIYTLKFDDSLEVNSVNAAMQSFTKSYKDVKQLYNDKVIGWEAHAKGKVLYEDSFLITIALDTYAFTGGAHGYSSTVFLNFDLVKSIELENYQLFKDLKGFEQLAENSFRAQNKIPEKGPINQTGFMFSDDTFHLPENLGFTEEGIQLIYNQYEVASYADGLIEVLISYEEAQPFLNYYFTE